MTMREFPPFRLDETNQCLWRAGDAADERIQVTPRAFAVLQYLVERAGRLVTQQELLDDLWRDTYVQPEVLKSHIAEIRRLLGDNPRHPLFIETLPRRGYRFIAPVNGPMSSNPQCASLSNSKVVGRDRELSELREYLHRAQRDQQQIAFVTGEAGIGKTALVDLFKSQATADPPGTRIACGQCIEGYGGKEAYYPMLEALGQLCRAPGGESVIELLAAQAPTWLVQFPVLMKRERPEMLRREIWGATRERMLREIGEVLEMVSSKSSLLLVFEDLHWVDHSTVDLISALARRRTPSKLMLIGTYRPVDVLLSGHPLNALKQDLLVHQLCHEIALEPLGESEVAAYLAADSGDFSQADGLAGLVYRHSEGNPLFMVAALEHMTERGLISKEKGIWKLKVPLEEIDLEVPESLRQMIEVQIERLTTEEQRALEVASITVPGFSPGVNALAANLDFDHFEELCEELSRRYHIVRSAGSQRFPDGTFSPRYEFVHALYREVFYRRQSPGRRAKLHRSIGDRLETLFEGHLDDVAPELAHHFEVGSDWSRAVKYLYSVAETAGRRYAPGEAARVLHHALELSSKLPETERAAIETAILEKVATMYVVAFDMRAVETYEALRTKAAYYGLIDVEVRALVDMVYPLSWANTARGLEAVEQALQLSARQTDPVMRARTRASCLVRRVWAAGWNARDAEDCRNALAEIRECCDSLTLHWHLLDCNFMQWCSSEYRAAHRDALESLAALLREYENNPYLSVAYWLSQFILPWSLLFLGEWGEALRVIKDGIEMGAKNGDHYRGQTMLIYQAWVHIQALDYRGVLAICESTLPSLGDPPRSPWSRLCRVLAGSAEAETGNHDRAIAYFSAVKEDMDRNTVIFDWYTKMLLESGIAELWFAKGDLAQAQTAAEKFLKAALETAEHTWQALAWETNARIAMAGLDQQRAQDCMTRAFSAMENFEVPLAAWRVHATAARLFEAAGEMDLATHHRALSRATILKLADSLSTEESLRQIFLAAPTVSQIIANPSDPGVGGAGSLPEEVTSH
jgi:DNA-binding winged helix-turn-helix (wHTH) protein/tetratricopeptide (TPR) repeat protein